MHTILWEILSCGPPPSPFFYHKYWGTGKVKAVLEAGHIDETRLFSFLRDKTTTSRPALLSLSPWDGGGERQTVPYSWAKKSLSVSCVSQAGLILHEPFVVNPIWSVGSTSASRVSTSGTLQSSGLDHIFFFILFTLILLSFSYQHIFLQPTSMLT